MSCWFRLTSDCGIVYTSMLIALSIQFNKNHRIIWMSRLFSTLSNVCRNVFKVLSKKGRAIAEN